jgi:hypothetical protein
MKQAKEKRHNGAIELVFARKHPYARPVVFVVFDDR